MPNINRVELIATSVFVWFSDGSYWMNLFVAKPTTFLYHATPAQRENWRLVDKGTAVEWPDLGEKLTLAQMGKA